MEKQGWKTTAIILCAVLVISWVMFGSLFKIGSDVINKEIKCGSEICFNSESYMFDEYTSICSCVIDEEIVSQEIVVLGG